MGKKLDELMFDRIVGEQRGSLLDDLPDAVKRVAIDAISQFMLAGGAIDLIGMIKKRPDQLKRVKGCTKSIRRALLSWAAEYHDIEYERACFLRWCWQNREFLEQFRIEQYRLHREALPRLNKAAGRLGAYR